MDLEIETKNNSPIKTIEKKERPKKYFTITSLNSTTNLTTDQIFKIFKNNNDDIIYSIMENNKDIIERDALCRCISMTSTKNFYSRKCKGCQIITRLIKTNNLKSNRIEIFSGREKNKHIYVKLYHCKSLGYTYEERLKLLLSYLDSNLKNIEKIKTNIDYFYTENKNYNYIINSIIVNTVLKNEKLYNYNKFLWSFICNYNLTIITKVNTYSNLKDLCNSPYYSNYSSPLANLKVTKTLSINCVHSIVKQLVYYFYVLKNYYYIHGCPSLRYISFASEKHTINKETFTLKLSIESSGFSSINYNNKRFSCKKNENVINSGVPVEKINVFVNGSESYLKHHTTDTSYDKISILFYKIGIKGDIFNKIRNNYGIPICYKSFDIICFLISLIAEPCFYNTFTTCEKLMYIWKNLWNLEEYENLMKDIKNMNKNNHKNIFNIVKKYYLRFDAVDYLYHTLFNID